MKRIAIIGAGNWGSALSIVASRTNDDVRLWSNNHDVAQSITSCGENRIYLPGFQIPEYVRTTTKIEEAMDAAEIIVTAVPSQVYRSVFLRMRPFLTSD